MDIKLKLYQPFMAALNRLRAKYGENFERMNGFHNSNLNFSDFIDNFVDSASVADTTIDANANSSTHDVRTLMSDMTKPHTKMLSFNKIFYELTKKYGLATAEKWLEDEWSGALYLHDAPSSSFIPYCILPQECCVFIYNGKRMHATIEDIYKVVAEAECFDETNQVWYKKPNNLLVLDIDTKNGKNRYTKVEMISHKETDEDFYFTKAVNGANVITTESHQFITANGDIQANALEPYKDVLYSGFDDRLFTNSIYEYNGLELTSDLGWLIGMYLAEGYDQRGQLSICQNSEKSTKEFRRLVDVLNKLGIPHTMYNIHGDVADVIRLKNGDFKWEKRIKKLFSGRYCNEKRLCLDYAHFNDEFLKGILAGIIDGDGTVALNRNLMIRMTSRALINQIREIGLHFGVFFGSRLPYIQSQDAKIRQTKPMYSANVNMNRNKEFFLSLPSIKIQDKFSHFEYDEVFANKNYVCEFGEVKARDVKKTYKPTKTVYDLSTSSHTFVCNNILVHNCYAYDLDKIVERGLFFINKFKTSPPKHLTTFNDHVLEFISWTANRSSGAVGLPSYLLYSYYFWHNDVQNEFYLKDPEYYRRQCFQKFVFDLNQPYLRITECAFTNISVMDRNYLIELFGGRTFPNGEYVIDHIDGIIEHQKVFMEVVSETRKNTMMTFPVISYSLLYQNGKFVDEDFARWCNKHNMEWYDSNFYVGSDVTSLSNCCRLISNTQKISAFINSIGGTSLSIGSVKVNTINLRRIALESNKDKATYISILNERIDTCVKALDVVREIIKRNIDKGLLPNYTYGLIEMEKQYNTIGITAMYEVINDFGFINTDDMGYKSYSEDGLEFAKQILDTINTKKESYGFEYSINVECIPAERANVVLCSKDLELYPSGIEYFIYSNQWIPLMEKCSLNEKIRLGAILDKECGGGQISHINLEGKFANEEQAWDLLNRIAMAGVIYFAYNCKISICKDEHAFFGSTCPKDGLPVSDTYSRIVGFLVPTSAYSKERKKEFDKRVWFDLKRDV